MKTFKGLVFLIIASAFVVFAIANRHATVLSLDPLPFEIELPLYLLVLGCIFLGMLIGGLAAWAAASSRRQALREARRHERELEAALMTARTNAAASRQTLTSVALPPQL